MDIFDITKEAQVADILEWALAGGKSLAISGNNSKANLGRPMEIDARLSLAGLSGIEMHEPAELVMKAKAGTSLEAIKGVLKQAGQKLAFAPPDYGSLLGQEAGQSTIGGVFACNLSGSERIKAGAARDHLLGVEGFSGRGEAFQTGSRVMKNVTGYDLCKLVCGSYGTIALCTSLTFKVLPRPEKKRTVLVFGLTADAAVKAMRDALSSVHEVSAAAYLPAEIAERTGIGHVTDASDSVAAFLIEGPAPSAEYRCRALKNEMAALGSQEELHGHNSEAFWSFVGDVQAFVGDQKRPVWKISVPPADAPSYLTSLQQGLPDADYYMDWGGGLIWVSVPDGLDAAGESIIRGSLKGDGHATLIRATDALRTSVSPFQPQNVVMAKLSEKVRSGFDPRGIFNPGRLYPVAEERS